MSQHSGQGWGATKTTRQLQPEAGERQREKRAFQGQLSGVVRGSAGLRLGHTCCLYRPRGHGELSKMQQGSCEEEEGGGWTGWEETDERAKDPAGNKAVKTRDGCRWRGPGGPEKSSVFKVLGAREKHDGSCRDASDLGAGGQGRAKTGLRKGAWPRTEGMPAL